MPAIDANGIEILENILKVCKKHKITVIFSHVNEQPMAVMQKAGIVEAVGADNFCEHIDAALERAEYLSAKRKEERRKKRAEKRQKIAKHSSHHQNSYHNQKNPRHNINHSIILFNYLKGPF